LKPDGFGDITGDSPASDDAEDTCMEDGEATDDAADTGLDSGQDAETGEENVNDVQPDETVKDVQTDLPPEEVCAQPETIILKGPYVQNVTQNSMTVAWETDKPACSPAVSYWTGSESSKNASGISEQMDMTFSDLPLPAPGA
jgi:hypothetical protein